MNSGSDPSLVPTDRAAFSAETNTYAQLLARTLSNISDCDSNVPIGPPLPVHCLEPCQALRNASLSLLPVGFSLGYEYMLLLNDV